MEVTAKVNLSFKAHKCSHAPNAWDVELIDKKSWGKNYENWYSMSSYFHVKDARDENDAIGQAKSQWLASQNLIDSVSRDRWWRGEHFIKLELTEGMRMFAHGPRRG